LTKQQKVLLNTQKRALR